MKTIAILILSVVLASCGMMSKDGESSKKTIEIMTSAECNDCKERLEGNLNYVKGIQFAELDVPSKVLTVKYDSKKITLQEIKDKINDIGYDADGQKAAEENVKQLPMCCQPGGMEK